MRTLETNDRLRVAKWQKLVRPDTSVALRIEDQTCVALLLVGMPVDAPNVPGATRVTVRVHAKLIFAPGGADRCQVSLAISAVHSPVIVAVIVDRSMAIEEEAVLAIFEGQCAVCAEEERVAVLRMGVRMHTVRIRAWRCAVQGGTIDRDQDGRQGQ